MLGDHPAGRRELGSMIPTGVLVKLAMLGLTAEQAAAVGNMLSEVETATREAAETVVEKSREKTRLRVQKWRENKTETLRNVTERHETLRNGSHEGVTRGEDNLQTKNITGQKENKKAASLSDLSAFKADLEIDASAEQVEAFAKHRKAKNGQNSAYAARLFRRDAEACRLSVADAIDTAISRGWLTVKPEYLAGRQSTAPPRAPPPKSRDFNDVLDELQGKTRHDAQPGPTFDASVNRADFGSPPGVVQLHALPARR